MLKRMFSLMIAMVFAFTFYGSAIADTIIIIPQNVKILEEEMFMGTSALDTVVVPYGATRIESKAFSTSGLGMIYIPATVKYIAEDAFDGSEPVICASSGSTARAFAEAHDLAWEASDYFYQQESQDAYEESQDAMENFRNEAEGTEALLLESREDESLEDVDDAETIALLEDYNAWNEELNQLILAYNEKVNAFIGEMDSLADYLSDISAVESGDTVTYQTSVGRFTIDSDMVGRLNDRVVDVSESDDGYYLVETAAGSTYYVTGQGDHFSLSASRPAAAVSSRAVRAFSDSAMLAKFKSLLDEMSSRFSQVEDLIDAETDALNILIETYTQQDKRLEDYIAQHTGKTAARARALRTINGNNLSGVKQALSLLKAASRALAALNIAGAIADGLTVYAQWERVLLIRDHGHPTDADYAAQTEDIAATMNKNINLLRNTYQIQGLMCAVRVVSSIISIASTFAAVGTGAASPPAWVAWATTLGGMVTSLASQGLGMVLDHYTNKTYELVEKDDKALHTHIIGKIVDKDTGEPIQGVVVSSGTHSCVTENDGAFDVPMPYGGNTLLCRRKGYQELTVPVQPIMGQTLDLSTLEMRANPSIFVLVKVKDEQMPIRGAIVTCGEDSAITDENGNCEFRGKEGNYILTASAKGYENSEEYPVTVGKDEQQLVVIELEKKNVILTREDLEAVALAPAENYVLGANIDLSDSPWIPNTRLQGELDGNGCYIIGMQITEMGQNNATGLFISINGGYVHDLMLREVSIDVSVAYEYTNVGGLTGEIFDGGRVENCQVFGTINVTEGNGTLNAGGLFGYGNNLTLINSGAEVDLTVHTNQNAYAGAIAGIVENCTGERNHGIGNVTVEQSGYNSGASLMACGTASFRGSEVGCSAGGKVRLKTTDGNGCAYGCVKSVNSNNHADVIAISESGRISAWGCYECTGCVNNGDITAYSSGQSDASAFGIQLGSRNENKGSIHAKSISGQAYAAGVQADDSYMLNSGSVLAETDSGNSLAYGIDERYPAFENVFYAQNKGAVTATCVSGDAGAEGIYGCLKSENWGNVTSTTVSGRCYAYGVYYSQYSTNYGTISATATGVAENVILGGAFANGVDGTACVNMGKVLSEVTSSAADARSIGANGQYCVNRGSVEARSYTGFADAIGVHKNDSQNYGSVLAYNAATSERASANAAGAPGNNSLNEGTITAISQSKSATAYGASWYNSSVSKGVVSATVLSAGNDSRANAGGSTSANAKIGSYSVSAAGNETMEIYYVQPGSSCDKHKGMAAYWTTNQTDRDSCYQFRGSVSAQTYPTYVMPEVPAAPAGPDAASDEN